MKIITLITMTMLAAACTPPAPAKNCCDELRLQVRVLSTNMEILQATLAMQQLTLKVQNAILDELSKRALGNTNDVQWKRL